MHHHSKNPLKLLLTLVLYTSIIHTVSGNSVYYIKPSTSDGCPESETCITLSTLIANTSNFLDDTNTTFILLEGNHTLDTDLNITDIDHSTSVRLSATNLVSVSITCTDAAGLNFNNIKQLQISGLELIRCRNRIESVGNFLLEDCHFCDGDNGSALLLTQTNTNIERCSFLSNTAGKLISVSIYSRQLSAGGALHVTSSKLSISNSQFDSNEAEVGGAIYIETGSDISITDCAFVNNKAVRYVAVILLYWYVGGGALYVVSSSAVVVHNSTFINNTAGSDGGAVSLYEAVFHDHQNIFHGNRARWGGAIGATYSMITIDSSSYSSNTADYGGAVYAYSSSVALSHNSFYNNEAADVGGAFYSIYNSNITAYNSSFDNNKARYRGGAISSYLSSIALHYSSFTNNEAVTNGGVILARSTTDITVYSCTFDNNKAGRHGGVVHTENSYIIVCNSSFANNTASNDGGAVYAEDSSVALSHSSFYNNEADYVGGAFCSYYNSNITAYNSSFDNNKARYRGGAIVSDLSIIALHYNSFTNNEAVTNGGVILATYYSHITVYSSTFDNNKAGQRGGIVYMENSDITVCDSSFANNTASYDGGVVYAYDSNITMNYSSFTNNEAVTNGGVIQVTYSKDITVYSSTFDNNKAGQRGGIVYMENSDITVCNSSFANNTASYDGGVVYAYDSSITMNYSSFNDNQAGNDGGVIYEDHTHTTLYSSSFMNNEASNSGGVLYKTNSNITMCFIRTVPTSNDTFTKLCTFVNNSAVEGGVMYIHDALLTDMSSKYQNNRASINGGAISLNKGRIKVNASRFEHNTAVNSGGVASTLIQLFQSYMTFEQSHFQHNRAFSGGVITMGRNDLVTVSRSVFTNNSAVRGGVVYLQRGNKLTVNNSSFSHNSADTDGGVFYSDFHNSLVLKDSALTYNRAEKNGGVICSLIQTQLNIIGDNCTFVGNQAQNGGAVYASDSGVTVCSKSLLMSNNSAVESGGAMYLSQTNLTFMNGKSMLIGNTANNGGLLYASKSKLLVGMNSQTTVDTNSATNNGGGLYLTMSELTVRGYSFHINRNRAERFGGGIFVDNCSFLIEGATHFANNEAENGGGIGLVNRAFITGFSVENVSFVNFSLNRASSYGGAMYVDDNSNSDTMCSALTEKNETTSNECFSKSLFFNFSDNSASKLGSNLFGGSLDICEVNETVDSPHREKGVTSFLRKSNIDESQLDTISSRPIQLCFCREGQANCDYQPETFRVNKRKKFSIEVIAYDKVHNAVNSIVSCSLNSSGGGLDMGQDLQNINAICTKLYFTLYSPDNYVQLTLSLDSTCKALGITEQRVMIDTTCSCPIGFQVHNNDQTTCDCVCDKVLQPYDKTDCDKQSQSIIRKDNFWINYINSSNSSGYVIYPNCPYDYCHTPEESIAINLINPEGYEAQCISKRSGTLCGSCKQNFSVSLGSSSCLPCPTYWPGITVTIITAFMLSGVCLVALLLVLNITVATGTLNAIIFYANIMAANKSAILSSSKVRFFSIFISWLNFDVGFDACFFDGMDMYVKTWLQLAFPLYIILLVIVIIKLSYHCDAFGRLIGRRDPVAMLATLVLLSYAKLLQTIITAFSSATLDYPDGSKKYVWLPDATVEYLTGKHAVLFFVALLILLAGLLYTLLLLTWQCLLHCPRRQIKLIMSQKLSSFLQTYHLPYTPKHRYWTGLLLLVRLIIYLISGFNPTGDPRISLLSTALVMCFLFLYSIMFGVRMYKNWLINAMETITYFNVTAVSILTWYALDSNNKYQPIITNISVGMTFIQLLLVVLYHTLKYLTSKLYSRIQETSTIKKVNERLIPSKMKKFDYKPIPADDDIHQFNELLDMIYHPVNTNDYNAPQVRLRPTKPAVTQSEVELPKPYLAPPPPPLLEEIKEEPEIEIEQQASEEDRVILGEENHSLHINKNKQCINDCCGMEISEHYNICLAASGTGMECNSKDQLVENSIPSNQITVEVDVLFSMDGGKSVEEETTVTPPIDTDIQQSEFIAPEPTALEPTAPESTAPESTAPESTAPESTAPESTARGSTALESTAPRFTAPEFITPNSKVPESAVSKSTV